MFKCSSSSNLNIIDSNNIVPYNRPQMLNQIFLLLFDVEFVDAFE